MTDNQFRRLNRYRKLRAYVIALGIDDLSGASGRGRIGIRIRTGGAHGQTRNGVRFAVLGKGIAYQTGNALLLTVVSLGAALCLKFNLILCRAIGDG